MGTIWNDLLGAEVKCYNAGGLKTRCIEAGNGPAIVLLHGAGGHAEAFSRNVIPLSDEFRVCAIDMLGCGLTANPKTDYEASELVDHLLRFMDAAGIDQACIGGVSQGGWISMWAALTHPHRVRKAMSIVGAGLDIKTDVASEDRLKRGYSQLSESVKLFSENPSRETLRPRLEYLFHTPGDVTEELLDLRWSIYQRPGGLEAVKRVGERGARNPKFSLTEDRLRNLQVPVLYLWTEFNPSTSASTARRAAELTPNAKFIEIKNCGHWPQWEKTSEFNQIIRDFCRSPKP